MPISLQTALTQISDEFAQKVFGAIRTAFVAELSNVTPPTGSAPAIRAQAAAPTSTISKGAKVGSKAAAKRGRLERRSPESIASTLDGIVALLRKKPGLGSEEIQKTLGLARNEIVRPITLGISTGVLHKSGEKRATKYSARATNDAPKKVARKATCSKKTVRVKKTPAKTERPVPPNAT